MGNNYLTDKKYWEKQISAFKPFDVTQNEFETILQKYLPVDPGFTCTEVGAYPGTNLCYMAKTFKYKPTAIEFRDDVDDIINLFEYNGISELEIINKDFLEVKGLQFDVVTSFGFIEHFNDYDTIIRQHVEMVKQGGYLVLSVPHFWGFQGLLRRVLLKKEAINQILETHNLKIMKLSILRKHLQALDLNILYSGYVMGCQFWIPSDSPKIKPEMRWLARIFDKLGNYVLPKMPPCFLYSPMILCVAKIN
jgi:2-polyprenyl-3-methyl-5-hydroxy-6-metoxy-1,4-benzoquinol methylase